MVRGSGMEHSVVPAAIDRQYIVLPELPGLPQAIRDILTQEGQTALRGGAYLEAGEIKTPLMATKCCSV